MLSTHLADKTLVMLVGPTAVGKSTIMNRVVELDGDFGRVSGFTTRARRPNDEPGMYRYVSDAEATQILESQYLVQHARNPANGQIYGTEISDYTHAFNMKDVLSGAVDNFLSLPFKEQKTVSITVPVNAWLEWLNSRYPEKSPERTSRLKEAKQSVEWSLAQSHNHAWLVNHPQDADSAARSLIALVRTSSLDQTPNEPKDMLKAIDDLLLYE